MAHCRYYDIEFCQADDLQHYLHTITTGIERIPYVDWTCDRLDEILELTSYFVYYDNNNRRYEAITERPSDARKRELFNSVKRHLVKVQNLLRKASTLEAIIYLSDSISISSLKALEREVDIYLPELKYRV